MLKDARRIYLGLLHFFVWGGRKGGKGKAGEKVGYMADKGYTGVNIKLEAN